MSDHLTCYLFKKNPSTSMSDLNSKNQKIKSDCFLQFIVIHCLYVIKYVYLSYLPQTCIMLLFLNKETSTVNNDAWHILCRLEGTWFRLWSWCGFCFTLLYRNIARSIHTPLKPVFYVLKLLNIFKLGECDCKFYGVKIFEVLQIVMWYIDKYSL